MCEVLGGLSREGIRHSLLACWQFRVFTPFLLEFRNHHATCSDSELHSTDEEN